jgi:hypothetical protein
VNYVSIFGIDPANKMNQYQFYKIYLFLQALFFIALMAELLNIKGYVHFGADEIGPVSLPTLVLIIAIFLFMINPFSYGYKKLRYDIILSLYYTMIAPFGLVRFKDFFFGDILTSMSKPMIDVIFIANYFNYDHIQGQSSGDVANDSSILKGPAWRNPNVMINHCSPTNLSILIVSFLPFHFRFW